MFVRGVPMGCPECLPPPGNACPGLGGVGGPPRGSYSPRAPPRLSLSFLSCACRAHRRGALGCPRSCAGPDTALMGGSSRLCCGLFSSQSQALRGPRHGTDGRKQSPVLWVIFLPAALLLVCLTERAFRCACHPSFRKL